MPVLRWPAVEPRRTTRAEVLPVEKGQSISAASLVLYSARKRTSVCNHSPMILARCSRSFGHVFGKT